MKRTKYKIRTLKWTEEEIRDLLLRSNTMVMKSVVELYKQQEDDEKASSNTMHHNGRGFTAYDAPVLTKLARKIINYGGCTDSDMTMLRLKMLKYIKQLTILANKKDPEYQLEFDLGGSNDEIRRNTKVGL